MKEMKKQLSEVVETVGELRVQVDGLETRFDGLEEKATVLQTDVSGLKDNVAQHGELLNAHANKLLQHDDRFDSLDEQIADFRREMTTRFDQVMTLLQTGQQERLFMLEWVKRNDKIIFRHDEEIGVIKEHIGLE